MSTGLFQNLPGAHEMGGASALPSEPWLLPISDRPGPLPGPASDATDALLLSVRNAARPARIAANALMALLFVMVLGQIAKDRFGAAPAHTTAAEQVAVNEQIATTAQVADAAPAAMPVSKASLTVDN